MTASLAEPTVADVIAVAAQLFGVTEAALRGPSRSQPLVHYRMIAMHVARTTTPYSYPCIADEFDRDHTTAVHAWQRVERTPWMKQKAGLVAAAVIDRSRDRFISQGSVEKVDQ